MTWQGNVVGLLGASLPHLVVYFRILLKVAAAGFRHAAAGFRPVAAAFRPAAATLRPAAVGVKVAAQGLQKTREPTDDLTC